MTEQQVEVQAVAASAPTIQEILAFLNEKFPACFVGAKEESKPLKVGIFKDLAEALADDDTFSNKFLRQGVRAYTRTMRYLDSVKEGAARVGLNGEEAGVVSAEEAEYAAGLWAEKRALWEARKAEERKERAAKRPAHARKGNKPRAPKASAESLAALADKFAR